MMSIPVMLLKAIQQLERLALATENSREKKPPAPEDRPNVAKIFQNEKDFNPCTMILKSKICAKISAKTCLNQMLWPIYQERGLFL